MNFSSSYKKLPPRWERKLCATLGEKIDWQKQRGELCENSLRIQKDNPRGDPHPSAGAAVNHKLSCLELTLTFPPLCEETWWRKRLFADALLRNANANATLRRTIYVYVRTSRGWLVSCSCPTYLIPTLYSALLMSEPGLYGPPPATRQQHYLLNTVTSWWVPFAPSWLGTFAQSSSWGLLFELHSRFR